MKRYFVTGSSSGIGLELSKKLLKDGHEVIGLSRRLNDDLANHERYQHITLDLADLHALTQAIENNALKETRKCDGVFLNAGAFGPPPDESRRISADDFLRVMKINCVANKILLDFFCSQNRSMTILVSASISSIRFRAGMSVYAASKAALNALCQIVALENPHIFLVNIGLCNVNTDLMQTGLTPNSRLPELTALRERARKKGYVEAPENRAYQLIEIINNPEKFEIKSGLFVEIREIYKINEIRK